MDDNEPPASDAIAPETIADQLTQAAATEQQRAATEISAIEHARTVPYGALAEERGRRRELQRELQAAAEARQRLQERLDALHTLAAQSDATAHQPVESEAGGEAHQAEQPTHKPADVIDAESVFRTQVLQSVRNYAAERPDFLDAYQHARQARVEELAALGYSRDEALAITFDNEREVINNAFATGRNPARLIYDFAVQRGYRPAGGATVGNTAAMSEAEKVALAARGQAGAKSLSAAGGGSTGMLTLEALADMSDEEFAEATKGERWQRLLRG